MRPPALALLPPRNRAPAPPRPRGASASLIAARARILPAALACLLAACGAPPPAPDQLTVRTSVTQALAAPLQSATFTLTPLRGQESAADYAGYAAVLRAQLLKRGMVETDLRHARYGVLLRYRADGDGSLPPLLAANMTVQPPPAASAAPADAARRVTVELIDVAGTISSGHAIKVYEAHAVGVGSRAATQAVVPAMLQSMFATFPAPNGATLTQTVELPAR